MLTKGNDFNADFSGSTLVTLIIENNKNLICANVGDSRAIVARQRTILSYPSQQDQLGGRQTLQWS